MEAPFVVAPGEAFHDQVKDLEPFLRKAKSLRMTHGLSSTDSRPTVHATDTYNKHRLLWPPIYDKVWMEQQVDAQGHTKKGDVCKVQRSGVGESDATMVTGEPMHELINLRRVLPSVGHDFADIYFDHAEAGLGILLTFSVPYVSVMRLELQTQAECAMDFLSVKFYPCIFSFSHVCLQVPHVCLVQS